MRQPAHALVRVVCTQIPLSIELFPEYMELEFKSLVNNNAEPVVVRERQNGNAWGSDDEDEVVDENGVPDRFSIWPYQVPESVLEYMKLGAMQLKVKFFGRRDLHNTLEVASSDDPESTEDLIIENRLEKFIHQSFDLKISVESADGSRRGDFETNRLLLSAKSRLPFSFHSLCNHSLTR